MTLEELNRLSTEDAYAKFEYCCVAANWVNAMVAARPFATAEACLQTANDIWASLSEADFLEAFEGHPRIGDVSTLKEKFARTAGSAGHEQSGMQQADDALLYKMKDLNDEYFDKFGFIFIVCATGKSAREMLDLLEARLPNDSAVELAIAAGEQAKITKIRLSQLLDIKE